MIPFVFSVFNLKISRFQIFWGFTGALQKCGDHSGPNFVFSLVEHSQTPIPQALTHVAIAIFGLLRKYI